MMERAAETVEEVGGFLVADVKLGGDVPEGDVHQHAALRIGEPAAAVDGVGERLIVPCLTPFPAL